ncbi:MAG: hypothetical protein ACJAX3_001098 [Patiriisocius sp.]|jgi:hypothetical protein
MAWTMSPGSYGRAEVYEFEIPEENLIKIIKEFKSDNSELDISSEDKLSSGKFPILRDGKEDSSNHWYKFYFYYPDKNQIIFTWTRAKSKMTSSFGFVRVNEGLNLGNWKDVNNNFLWWKNTPMKNEFEERILKKIKEKLDR